MLIEYAQGKLNAKDIYKVEYHLIDCKLCSDALEGYKIGKNIKLEVYDMKLQVLRLSEQNSMHKFIRLVNGNKAFIKVAAALVLFLGIIGLMFKAISSLNMEEKTFAENKKVIVKDLDKIDHTIQVTPKLEKADTEDAVDIEKELVLEESNEMILENSSLEEKSDLEKIAKEESSFELEIEEEENSDLAEFNSESNESPVFNENLDSEMGNTLAKRVAVEESTNSNKLESGPEIKRGLSRIEAITEMRKLTDAQKYSELILTYNAYESIISDDVEILFYLASAYNYTNDVEKSVSMHQQVISMNDPYYKVESKWQLVNIYLAKEEKDKAAVLLEDLIRSNSRYKKSAQDIRKTLGN